MSIDLIPTTSHGTPNGNYTWDTDGINKEDEEWYSPKQKADGYYGHTDGVHTVAIFFDGNFLGSVTMQGTLAEEPGEADWFDINKANGNPLTFSRMSKIDAGGYTENFTGNFVWIRAKIKFTDGTISKFQYNY